MTARSPVEFTNINHQRVGNQVEIDGVSLSVSGSLPITFGDSPSIDAFARQRISNPFTLFDGKQVWDNPDIANSAENFPLFFDNQEISGGGTTTLFNVDRASTTLAVANATAGNRVRQTKQRFNYQPGKSMLVILTGIVGISGDGITKRFGYYDDNNGLFYQSLDNVWSVCRRSNVTGTPVDDIVNQAEWNLDKLDGIGLSGKTLDKAASQIFFLDFEWLGTGRIRFGFFIDGMPIYVHQMLHSNILDVVYMSTPNLPVRFEIDNDGTGAAASLQQMCSTVISEGGIQPNGTLRFGDIGETTAEDIAAATPGVIYAICGIRLKAAYLSADVREALVSLIESSGSNNPFLWKLHFNPTIVAALTYADVPNSAIQFGIGDTGTPANNVISASGTVIAGGYQARTDATASINLNSALRLGSLIDGTPDELILSGSPLSNNQLYFGGLQWREAW